MRILGRLSLLALLGALPLAGCDKLGIGNDRQLSLSFEVPGSGSGSGRSAALLMDTLRSGSHVLDLQTVAITFDKVVLQLVGADTMKDHHDKGDDDDQGDSDHKRDRTLKGSPVTINLPLHGGVITPIDAAVPNGDYDELDLTISQVRFTGTFDGQAFDVTVPVHKKIDLTLDPIFSVDSNTDRLNVTIMIDALSWFHDVQGRLLDPRLLSTDSSLRSFLVSRIRDAFRAFEDSDKDGHEKDSDSDSGHHRK
jgi:hypothetical protein